MSITNLVTLFLSCLLKFESSFLCLFHCSELCILADLGFMAKLQFFDKGKMAFFGSKILWSLVIGREDLLS